MGTGDSTVSEASRSQLEKKHFRSLLQHTLLRMLLLYYMPLLLLALFFHLQYHMLLSNSSRRHLTAVAEQQAAMLDLFLSERLVNLSNVIDGAAFPIQPTDEELRTHLSELQAMSQAFVELGVLDGEGSLLAYAGPHPFLQKHSYRDQSWFTSLGNSEASYIITDAYLGFRDAPHFTIAVKRRMGGEYRVLRGVLSPDEILRYMNQLQSGQEVHAALINRAGILQVGAPELGRSLQKADYQVPGEPDRGAVDVSIGGEEKIMGYCWLSTSPWVLVNILAEKYSRGIIGNLYNATIVFTVLFALIGAVIISMQARRAARAEWEREEKEKNLSGQLVQASKLASVGELAAGIAHEINNPLAIIAEQVGLVKDRMDPQFGGELKEEDLNRHLQTINEAVYRCRDITRKLLGFVRQSEFKLEHHDIHILLDQVLDGMLGNELSVSSIQVVRDYCDNSRPILTDQNQIQQVILNLVKNAMDAIEATEREGRITVRTLCWDDGIQVVIRDNGCGMNPDQLEKIFMPFYTTKDPGKGTGLGLSVSYGIINGLGGLIYVDSKRDVGSVFTLEFPCETEA